MCPSMRPFAGLCVGSGGDDLKPWSLMNFSILTKCSASNPLNASSSRITPSEPLLRSGEEAFDETAAAMAMYAGPNPRRLILLHSRSHRRYGRVRDRILH